MNLDTATGYSIKNSSLQDSFKIIIKKKVILQKGYNKYKPLSKNGYEWLQKNQKNIWRIEGY